MGYNNIKRKYGGSNKSAVNRAIRAELTGGNEALEALTAANRLCIHRGIRDPETSPAGEAVMYRAVFDIVQTMENEIWRRAEDPAWMEQKV